MAPCRNCGRPAGPQFCGHCGQALDDRRSPLVTLLRDLLEEWLSVDGRLLRTLRVLPRPGRLTREYLDGRRVPYLAPFRLYLLASVALFSSLLALGAPRATEVNLYIAGQLVTGTEPIRDRGRLEIGAPNSPFMPTPERFRASIEKLRERPPQQVLDGLFAGLRSVLPVALIVFVPVLALALKLLYLRDRILYVDHLIFGIHFQSALFLALSLTWLLLRIARVPFFASVLSYLLVFLVMLTWYLARSLRQVYGQGRGLTALKTALLIAAYFVLLQPVIGVSALLVILRI